MSIGFSVKYYCCLVVVGNRRLIGIFHVAEGICSGSGSHSLFYLYSVFKAVSPVNLGAIYIASVYFLKFLIYFLIYILVLFLYILIVFVFALLLVYIILFVVSVISMNT